MTDSAESTFAPAYLETEIRRGLLPDDMAVQLISAPPQGISRNRSALLQRDILCLPLSCADHIVPETEDRSISFTTPASSNVSPTEHSSSLTLIIHI